MQIESLEILVGRDNRYFSVALFVGSDSFKTQTHHKPEGCPRNLYPQQPSDD